MVIDLIKLIQKIYVFFLKNELMFACAVFLTKLFGSAAEVPELCCDDLLSLLLLFFEGVDSTN